MARGHLVQRAEGSWTVVVSAGRDPESGKRRRIWRTVRGTKKQANEVMTALLAEFDRGITPGSGKLTVGEWAKTWLSTVVAQRNRPRTAQSYETICRVHIVPALGRIQLHKLEPSHVDRLMSSIIEKGRTANTAGHVFTVLRKALTDAEKRGLVGRNVCRLAETPHVEKYSVKMPDMDAIARVLEYTDQTELGAAFRVAYHTGLRRGEILALKWANIDLENGALAVVESVQSIKGQGVTVQPTKSSYGKRGVALDAGTVALLKQHRVRQAEHILKMGGIYRDRDIVFASATGDYVHPDTMTKAARLAARKAGFPGLRLHDLRHAHAEGLIRAGVHAKVVQERLGHASPAFTLAVYGHVAAGLQAQAADAFSKLVSARGG